MVDCRFCRIQGNFKMLPKIEDTIVSSSDDFFSLVSVGALVEGWMLVIPKKHTCSMKELYDDEDFVIFINKILEILYNCYGSVIAFEHGPNKEGSETSCGTDHAHIHLVPFHSLALNPDLLNLDWIECKSSDISSIVKNNEYLLYCDLPKGTIWNNPICKIHILETSVSQFFRKVIAKELDCVEKYNYKLNCDNTLSLKTIETLSQYLRNED